MKEQKMIQKQLLKNMLFNLVTFSFIFSFLGLIIYFQVRNSLYKSSDEELLNNRNRLAIMQDLLEQKEKKKEIPEENLNTDEFKNKRKQPQEANPRLIYIFRDHTGEIMQEAGKYHEEYFEEIGFDSNNLDKIYPVTVNSEYQYRAINYLIEQDGKVSYAQIFINVDAEERIIQDFTRTLVISIIICISLSIIASFVLSKYTLRPIIKSWGKQTEFVQNASHELRTPLTIIQAKQELLLEEPQSKIIDKAKEINICLNETRRLTRLVKDLMVLARADSDQIQIKKEKTKFDLWIQQIAEPFSELAQGQEKEFLFDLNYSKEIEIDRSKMQQVLIILLDNAIKYTEKGEKIIVSTSEKEGKLILDVIDTGIGMTDVGLKHVFDRFYREDKARNRETGGSGLGLSIAHYMIEQHGGTIKAFSQKPKGSKFEIRLR